MRNFEEWKWRSLRKRRVFFFFFINVILTLAWAVVHYDEPNGDANADTGENYTKGSFSDSMKFQLILLYGLPSFFFYLHAIGCVFISFTSWGQRVIQETQGRKFCIWSAVSLCLAAFYLLIPLMYRAPNLNSSQRMAVFASISTIVISSIHHFGLPQRFCWGSFSIMSILWILYMRLEKISTPVVLTIAFSQFVLTMTTFVQDFEFRRIYSQLNDTSSSKAAGSTFFTIVDDVSFALCRIDLLIDQLHTLMEHHGFSPSEENEDGSQRFHSLFSSLQESRQLCQAVYAALMTEDSKSRDMIIKRNAQYTFHNVCSRIFATFEANSDSALPLFIDENAKEIFITDPNGVFELVLFLLIYEAVKGSSNDSKSRTPTNNQNNYDNLGVCYVSCTCDEGVWQVRSDSLCLNVLMNLILEECHFFA